MQRLTILLILGLTTLSSKAQTKGHDLFVGNVISDTTSFKSDNYTALTSILKSKNKIEIRFISIPSFSRASYTILTYNKKWIATTLYYKKTADSLVTKDINSQINLDSIFNRLVSNNIFSLPDQSTIKPKKYSYNTETDEFVGSGMSVCDGISYWIEFKVGDHFRRYKFHNPDSYANFYPTVYEFKNFVNIVNTFDELTKN